MIMGFEGWLLEQGLTKGKKARFLETGRWKTGDSNGTFLEVAFDRQ